MLNLFDNETLSPQFNKFVSTINNNDVARPNLFLVRFGNLLNPIMGDGVIDFPEKNGFMGSLIDKAEGGINNAISNAGDNLLNSMAGSSIGGVLMGAYSPDLISSITGGDLASMIPAGLDLNTSVGLLCKAARIPSITLDTEKSVDGRFPYHYTKGRNTGNTTLSFYASVNMAERNAFMSWMQSVHNPKNNEYGFYDSIIRDIEIIPLSRGGKAKSIIKMSDCYPIRLGEISMNTDSNNEVCTFDVEFCVADVSQYSSMGNPILAGFSESLGGTKGEQIGNLVNKIL